MTRTSLSNYPCPVARAVDVIGDPWSFLVLRDVVAGVRRFSDFKARLGVSSNILTDRLNGLVEAGVLERRRTRPGVQRFEYVLTQKGEDFLPALIALMQWGERWAFDPGCNPVTVQVRDTGEALAPLQLSTESGRKIGLSDLELTPTSAAPAITRQAYDALNARSTQHREAGS